MEWGLVCGQKFGKNTGAEAGHRVQVEDAGESADCAQAIPGRAVGGVTVLESFRYVVDAGPLIEREYADTDGTIMTHGFIQQFSVLGVLDEVGCHLSNGNCNFAAIGLVETNGLGEFDCNAARFPGMGRIDDLGQKLPG